MTMQVETPYLSVWEAASTLAETSSSGATGADAASSTQRWQDAIRTIEGAARRGALSVIGRRKSEPDPTPIGVEFWIGASIDPDTGWLCSTGAAGPDQNQHIWAELRFAADEIRALTEAEAPAPVQTPVAPDPVSSETHGIDAGYAPNVADTQQSPTAMAAHADHGRDDGHSVAAEGQPQRQTLITRVFGAAEQTAPAQAAHTADTRKNPSIMAPYDPELDRRLKARIEAVLREARQRWPNGQRPSWRMMARVLTDAGSEGKLYDLGMEAVRKILHGTYPAQRRLGIAGFSAYPAS